MLTVTFVLWLIMLVLVVAMLPAPGGWGKPAVWAALALLTVVLVLTGAIHFKG